MRDGGWNLSPANFILRAIGEVRGIAPGSFCAWFRQGDEVPLNQEPGRLWLPILRSSGLPHRQNIFQDRPNPLGLSESCVYSTSSEDGSGFSLAGKKLDTPV